MTEENDMRDFIIEKDSHWDQYNLKFKGANKYIISSSKHVQQLIGILLATPSMQPFTLEVIP